MSFDVLVRWIVHIVQRPGTASLLVALLAGVSPLQAEENATPLRREGHEMVLTEPLEFAAGSADGLPHNGRSLELIRAYLATQPTITLLRIEGHVSNGGDERSRLRLSLQRAQWVAQWLVAQGIDCKRLIPVGFGSSKPRFSEGHAGNERIQFINAALRGRPIGGAPIDGGGMPAEWSCPTESAK